MAKTYTRFKKSGSVNLSYNFICNYCGHQNTNKMTISESVEESHGGYFYGRIEGTDIDRRLSEHINEKLRTIIIDKLNKIEDYRQGLIEGRRHHYYWFINLLKGDHPDYLGIYSIGNVKGKCSACGKKQAWSINPVKGTWIIACFFIGTGIFLTMSIFDILEIIFVRAGFVEVIALLILIWLGVFAISGKVQQWKIEKNQDKIAAMPNDPDKLPKFTFGF